MTRRMTLCPNCRTIQKAHSICSICGARVLVAPAKECAGEASRSRRPNEWRDVIAGHTPRKAGAN